MTNNEENHLNNLIDTLKDTVEHKKIVLDVSFILAKHLIINDSIDLGMELLRRASEHDNSKFNQSELDGLIKLTGKHNNKTFIDPEYSMTECENKLIQNHWRNNRHHPEFYTDKNNMEEIDIIEMVCDWYARSRQYKTNFISFVITRQHNRFKFNTDVFKRITYYCNLIVKLDIE